jgi:hypothetical protein
MPSMSVASRSRQVSLLENPPDSLPTSRLVSREVNLLVNQVHLFARQRLTLEVHVAPVTLSSTPPSLRSRIMLLMDVLV